MCCIKVGDNGEVECQSIIWCQEKCQYSSILVRSFHFIIESIEKTGTSNVDQGWDARLFSFLKNRRFLKNRHFLVLGT